MDIKEIDAGVLSVGYAETGPVDGPAVVLLHGWPYDIHSYTDVRPLLAAEGYRVIVPFVRGFGTTRFRSSQTMRNGQPAAVAADVIDLMDVLSIDRAVLGGFDWGARSANIVAALWPERCKGLSLGCHTHVVPLRRTVRTNPFIRPSLTSRLEASCVCAPPDSDTPASRSRWTPTRP